jgi:hypothetical protein
VGKVARPRRLRGCASGQDGSRGGGRRRIRVAGRGHAIVDVVAAVHGTAIGRDYGGTGWRGAEHAAEASEAETREGDAKVCTVVAAMNSVSSVELTT